MAMLVQIHTDIWIVGNNTSPKLVLSEYCKHNSDVWMVGKMDLKIRKTRNRFCGDLSNIGIVVIAACITVVAELRSRIK